MEEYRYSYLLLAAGFMILWAMLYWWREDVRKEMLAISAVFGVAGLLIEPFYLVDWWRPLTITRTPVGIEDFIFGFAAGGVAAVLYEEVFKKRLRTRRERRATWNQSVVHAFVLLSLPTLFLALFFFVSLNTFWTTILALAIPIGVMALVSPHLVPDILMSGVLLLLSAVVIHSFVDLVTPGWVEALYLQENVPEIVVWNVSIDDVVWYLLIGAYIGPLYEFIQERRLTPMRNPQS